MTFWIWGLFWLFAVSLGGGAPWSSWAQESPAPEESFSPEETQSPEETAPPVEPLSEGESFETPPAEEGEVAVLEVLDGRVVIEFYPESAPDHVANFKKLARQGFYNGTAFHRVIPGYLIQGGDPNTKDDDRTNDGEGSVGYRLPAEINHHRHVPGTVSMAFPAIPDPKGDRASDGSQFFICLSPAPLLDGRHTVFGQVSQGFDLLRRIGEMDRDERNNPLDRVEIKKVSILPKRAVP